MTRVRKSKNFHWAKLQLWHRTVHELLPTARLLKIRIEGEPTGFIWRLFDLLFPIIMLQRWRDILQMHHRTEISMYPILMRLQDIYLFSYLNPNKSQQNTVPKPRSAALYQETMQPCRVSPGPTCAICHNMGIGQLTRMSSVERKSRLLSLKFQKVL